MLQRCQCKEGHAWHVPAGAPAVPLVCPVCGGDGVATAPVGPATVRESATSELRPSECGPRPFMAEPKTLPLGDHVRSVEGKLPTVPGYETLDVLGLGGMGIVYKARQQALNRIVALKMTLAGTHTTPADRARFRAEAEAVAQLHHPNIVQVFEVGEQDGCPFFALEYVDGGSLFKKTAGAPQPPLAAAALLEVLARTMHHAHQRGIVHRDLKPSNILLQIADSRLQNERGGAVPQSAISNLQSAIPKITDFGLAKRLEGGSATTRSGVILGTPDYMAPEQARGESGGIGPAADIYSLGAILYELLTGRPPFRGATPLDTLHQVTHDEPVSPRRLQPKVPRDLETICLKCLEKEPHRRYASALELADDLGRFVRQEPIHARPLSNVGRLHRWCKRNPRIAGLATAVAVLLVGLAVVSTLFSLRMADARDEASRHAADAETARVKADANAQESRQRLVRTYVTTGARALGGGDLYTALHWFVQALALDAGDGPGGERHRIRIASVLRQCPKPARAWFHHGATSYGAFRPDGRRVVTAGHDGVARVWDAATGQPVTAEMRHADDINLAVFSPDGRFILTASEDKTARLWDAETGRPLGPPLAHEGNVIAATFAPGGKLVATASWDHRARLWDVLPDGTARLRHTFTLHDAVWWVAFSPDGGRLAVTDGPGARVYDVATGRELAELGRHEGPVGYCAWSPDGGRLVTGGEDGTARLWEAATGKPVGEPLRHGGGVVNGADFSPDGKLVATGGGPAARVWDAATGRPVCRPLVHRAGVWDVAFSPDGRHLVTAAGDTARVWDATTGRPTTPPLAHGGLVNHAVFSPDGRHVLSVGGDNVQLWDLALGPPLVLSLVHARPAFTTPPAAARPRAGEDLLLASSLGGEGTAVGAAGPPPVGPRLADAAFDPGGGRLVTAGDDGTARVWDAATGRPLLPPLRHPGPVRQVVFGPAPLPSPLGGEGPGVRGLTPARQASPPHPSPLPQGERGPQDPNLLPAGEGTKRLLATVSADRAYLWDALTGLPAAPPLKHDGPINHVDFRFDGRRVVTASADHTARVWDTATGRPTCPPLEHQDIVNVAAFSPDGRRLLTASADRTLQVWDAETGRALLAEAPRHRGSVRHAAFSPDGRLIVTGTGEGTARVWDAATGRPVTAPLRHNAPILHVGFSPDGRLVVTTSSDRTARIWETTTGHPLTAPLTHAGAVTGAAFSPDSSRLLTAGEDGVVQLWSAVSGQPLTPALRLGQPVTRAAFSPDGRRVLTAAGDRADLWQPDLVPDDRSVGDLALLAQLLDQHQIDATDGLVPVDAVANAPAGETLRARSPQSFTASADDLLRWHRAEARDCERKHAWAGAAAHLDALAAAGGLTWGERLARGAANAELGRWASALADFDAAVETRDGYRPYLHLPALARLGKGDLGGFREACARLAARFGGTEDPELAHLLASLCVLVPEALAPPDRVLRLAQTAATAERKTAAYQATLGAAFYRTGRFADAVKQLESAVRLAGTPGERECLFLALAQRRLGHEKDAQEWLAKAPRASGAWEIRVVGEALRREAEGN